MKILVLDIETAPAVVYSFGLYNQNHSIDQIVEPPYMLCFAAKWYGQDDVMFYRHDDKLMVPAVWNLLDEADAVVHFNGQSFDIPHMQRELLLAGFKPPSPFAQIDLLKVVRKQFKFISNKLDNVAQELGIGHKVKHAGFSMWPKVMSGDPEAWKLFQEYNEQDVLLTEALYDRLLPWIPTHPNVLLYDENPGLLACPRCGSSHYQSRGTRQLATGIYNQYQCQSCFGWFREMKRQDGSTVR